MVSKRLLIIGHRGACGHAPENTLSSFEKARELGVDIIELDVHQCASGQLVVIHDETVDRTTNGTGLVAQKTYEQLSQFDAGNGEKIPLLSEVLDFVDQRVIVDIEIKDAHAADALGALLVEYVEKKGWQWHNFLVTSFNLALLVHLKNKFPQIPRAPIFEHYSKKDETFVKEVEPSIIVIDYKKLTKEILHYFHQQKIRVFVYTVNSVHAAQELMQWGVDGIISDYPDRISSLL